MKAIVYDSYGKAEIMRLSEVSEPEVMNNGQVKVLVHGSSVNPVDWKIRRGMLRMVTGKKFPRIPGADFSGVVIESKSSDIRVGDEVFGMVKATDGGCSAEKIVVSDKFVAPKPSNIDFIKAGVIPLAGLTALQALKDIANIEAGDQVLINGCTGGVGTFAVKIAKAFDARVTGVCSNRNIEYSIKLGCNEIVDYTTQPVYTDDKYDIIFDTIGNLNYGKAKKMLIRKGIYVTCAVSPLKLINTFFRRKCKMVIVKPDKQGLKFLKDIAEQGKLSPEIQEVHPLYQLVAAHLLSEKGKVNGKIAIRVR